MLNRRMGLWVLFLIIQFSGNTFGNIKKNIFLALGNENIEGFDPTQNWGHYGPPLFQSTLLKRDENLNIVNDLAVNYKLSQNKKVWKIEIRKDVKFSDGHPLTAEDVVYTFQKAALNNGKTDISNLQEIFKTGKYSLEIHLKNPQITFLHLFTTLGIVPKRLHTKDYSRKPIGSGPYKLKFWSEGQKLIIERNPYYYGIKPQIERVTFLFLDENTAFSAAKAQKIHLLTIPESLASEKVSNMNLRVVDSVENRGIMFPMLPRNGKKTKDGHPIGNNVTSNLAIRKALNVLINRKELVKGVLRGLGSPAYGPIHFLPWENKAISFSDGDQELALKILKKDGWSKNNQDGIMQKNGLKAEFDLFYVGGDTSRQGLVLAIRDKAKKIGIKITPYRKSWEDIEKLQYSNAVLYGWGAHNPYELYKLFHSSMAGVGFYNPGYYSNKQIDKYLEMALQAKDFNDSLKYWKMAQWDGKEGLTTKGDAPWLWIANVSHTYMVHNCLDLGKSQLEPHGHGMAITANIQKWKWKCQK